MSRKTICELDEEEIRQVIADHFNVDTCKVTMIVKHEVRGVGPMEYEGHYVGCKVELTANAER